MSHSGTTNARLRLEPEQARASQHLLLLANPNYFGNSPDSAFQPVYPLAGDTAYEQIGCVGYSAALGRLTAVVSIKQSSGFAGALCTAGSQEYVRFYLSHDDGASWADQGVASFSTHDLPGPKPLEYAVALPVSLPEEFCFVANLPLVRAILSWNQVPPAGTPGFQPVWGNVAEARIQVPGRRLIVLSELLAEAKVSLPSQLVHLVDTRVGVPLHAAAPVPLARLASLYPHSAVPAARLYYPHLSVLAAAHAVNPSKVSLAGAAGLSALKIDVAGVVATILGTSGDTTYERLGCVGLDANRSAVTAVASVLRSAGYNGGPCTAGSTEYVAFWIDWGGGFEYVGTTSFAAHDLAGVGEGGVQYAVCLPVDLASHAQPCTQGARTATVRAVLSWQSAPPAGNADFVPAWGNRVDALVQIPPGEPFFAGTPDISVIGGIGIGQIDTVGTGMTLPGALFALTGGYADPWVHARACAFGGQIVIQGLPSPGSRYRVWTRREGAPLPVLLTDAILVTNGLGVSSSVSPDGNGYFSYLDVSQNIDNVLASWSSAGDDVWTVWLEIADQFDNALGATPPYRIRLDNTAPVAAIHIDNGGDCRQFGQGGTIEGHFVATDVHMGAFSLETTPATLVPPPQQPVTATPGTSATAPAPGDAWSLPTAGMRPCGYVIRLEVYDNTIVGSGPGSHNAAYADVGFCLIAPN